MRRIEFYKLQASGNDFILVEGQKPRSLKLSYKDFAKEYCQRKFGVGADGLLVIEPSRKADFRMRIFNPDGSEAEMCGNGARCAALWASSKFKAQSSRPRMIKLETKAGIVEAKVCKAQCLKSKVKNLKINNNLWGNVMIKMSEPYDLRFNIPIKVFGRTVKVNFINTGVPHAVIFVEGLDKINVEEIGRALRFHKKFSPQGANVDFLEFIKDNYVKIRTYERGVEAETLACGTGVVASAIVASYQLPIVGCQFNIRVLTRSGEALEVYFNRRNDNIEDVWLEGKAYLIYKGEVSLKVRSFK
jgi:diaminopimelate epimerase